VEAREGERGACEDEGDLGKNAPSRSPVFHSFWNRPDILRIARHK